MSDRTCQGEAAWGLPPPGIEPAMPTDTWTLVLIILLALAFDFLNGFHDAANSIRDGRLHASPVAAKGRPLGGILQLRGGLRPGHARGQDAGEGMIDLSVVTQEVIAAGLIRCDRLET